MTMPHSIMPTGLMSGYGTMTSRLWTTWRTVWSHANWLTSL